MALKVEDREATDVSDSVDVNCKFSKKVDNAIATVRKRKPKHEGCCQHTQDFLQKDSDFQIVKSGKFSSYLFEVRNHRQCLVPYPNVIYQPNEKDKNECTQ
jgi:hypothetical protein